MVAGNRFPLYTYLAALFTATLVVPIFASFSTEHPDTSYLLIIAAPILGGLCSAFVGRISKWHLILTSLLHYVIGIAGVTAWLSMLAQRQTALPVFWNDMMNGVIVMGSVCLVPYAISSALGLWANRVGSLVMRRIEQP